MTAGRLGLFGGTFDPIHVGHVAAADAVCRALQLDQVWLLTSNVPPHRPQPRASVHHRFAMVALTVQDRPLMRASDFELLAEGPSYTAATLARLHAAGLGPAQLFFIVGADAFAEIATWRDYPRFLDAANFAVVSRGGQAPASPALDLAAVRPRIRSGTEVPVAASGARSGAGGGQTGIYLVHHTTPDVSSTDVRDRRGRGESIAGLVAPPVERHILQHELYASGAPVAPHGHLTTGHLHEQEHH
jgi:nicotinate-nucleotide adenylyltransferase